MYNARQQHLRKALQFLSRTEAFSRKIAWSTTPKSISTCCYCCSTTHVVDPRIPSTRPSFRNSSCHPHFHQWKTLSTAREENNSADVLKESAASSSSPGRRVELDFFGEPVTFRVGSDFDHQKKTIANAVAALDGFLLAVVSKGKSCVGGGDEAGLDVKGAHAVALSWSELLKHAAVWNQPGTSSDTKDHDGSQQPPQQYAPMLVVTAVAPVLVQTGTAYLHHLDTLLRQASSGVAGLPRIQMMQLARQVVSLLSYQQDDVVVLDERERLHLQALQHLVENHHRVALVKYLHLLRQCPGDALALSLAMDLCQTLGDKEAALRVSGSVAAYWNERCGGLITPAIPGHAMASAWIALGFAVSGRHADAEHMAERAMKKGRKVGGAIATWAQVHVFDAGGRTAEGISACANFDGTINYEGSGFLFFDCRLGGYGARFALDREERGRGQSAALRLYDRNFERVLDYSGFASGQAWQRPMQRAPLAWTEPTTLLGPGETSDDNRTMMEKLFGKKKAKPKYEHYEIMTKATHMPSTRLDGWKPSFEDVLTWVPPSPQLLSDATLLLLRFTLNGTISTRNYRWDNVRNGWSALLDIQSKHGPSTTISFCPLASITASLLFPPSETGGDRIGHGHMAKALHEMGLRLRLGNPTTVEEESRALREVIADRDPNFWLPVEDEESRAWMEIVKEFAAAIDGYHPNGGIEDRDGSDHNRGLDCWNFDARPLLDHAVCYAACKAGDAESLSLARAICSQGVTLRTNSPEEWWRYSIVLGLLGDEVGSEDAMNNSINFGGGQGARRI